MKIEFTEIDFEKWSRTPYFKLYTQMIPTGFTTCVDLDITKMRAYFKEKGYKFGVGYRYITLKVLNSKETTNFRIAMKGGKLGYYNHLVPSFTNFHEDDKTSSVMWTDYDEDFKTFYNNYIEETEKYKDVHGILAKPGLPPENACMVGALPWISFTSYSPVPYAQSNLYFPVIETGKPKFSDGKELMPFSIMVHHAVADGYNVAQFLDELQEQMNKPEEWAKL